MTLPIYAQLALLALIDSTSVGTLLIPLWLLLRPDARRIVPRILLYLGVLAGFYLLIGVALLSGADWALNGLGADSLTQLPGIQWGLVVAGSAMLIYALFSESPKKPAMAKVPATGTLEDTAETISAADAEIPSSQATWQIRIAKALRSPGGLVTLALIAGLLELPTMLPYLLAIGTLSDAAVPLAAGIGVLAVYCLLMLAPAVVLLSLRMAFGSRLDSVLWRLSNKLGKFASEALLWVVGIVGFLLLRTGLAELAPGAPWNPFK
ncbi:GAP family protein [Arthrobacter sp. GMC3]|uniref:GAP family protein n=1 Tax=Arthrobacter sp. GMC3 TaxID=2058894 RepID=UPI000CE4E643|nr:GAP family protein [Arthrobacter sp. GMC3]